MYVSVFMCFILHYTVVLLCVITALCEALRTHVYIYINYNLDLRCTSTILND